MLYGLWNWKRLWALNDISKHFSKGVFIITSLSFCSAIFYDQGDNVVWADQSTVAEWVAQSLPTTEDPGSNPGLGSESNNATNNVVLISIRYYAGDCVPICNIWNRDLRRSEKIHSVGVATLKKKKTLSVQIQFPGTFWGSSPTSTLHFSAVDTLTLAM